MSIVADFRSLAQDMVAAYEKRIADAGERAQRVAEIKEDTAVLLQGFDGARSEMSSQLKSELADETSKLRSEAQTIIGHFREDFANAAAAWRDLVATMQAKRGIAIAGPLVKLSVAEVVKATPKKASPRRKAKGRK